VPRLRRSDCGGPGIARVASGRGFRYRQADGSPVKGDETRERIAGLAIPPAWRDVWICPYENGHLQATGIDAAGRKQYLYHPGWRAAKDREKFDEMLDFAALLPALRSSVIKDLRRRGVSRERVMACALRLLDLGFFRIGSEDYAETNETFGLATIKKKHVKIVGGEAVFDYPAKSGQQRVQAIVDPSVVRVIAELKKRRGGGDELLAFKTDSGRWQDVRSEDINAHLKASIGGDFSAKDFRTWNGTVLAAVSIAGKRDQARTPAARKRASAAAVKEVAYFLGNTPAVARGSYIDPRVFDRFDSGWTIAARIEELGGPEAFVDPEGRVALEDAVRDLLEDRKSASPALDKVPVSRG
jgi:DNA topoisomerase IB